MGENNKSELLEHNVAIALENQRRTMRPLATAGGGWEKDLRISTPVMPTNHPGLTPLGAKTECFTQQDLQANESQNKVTSPTAKQSPHFDIKNAEIIEDNKHG